MNVDGFVTGLAKLIGRLALRFWPLTLVVWGALVAFDGRGGGPVFLVLAVLVAVLWYGWRLRLYRLLPSYRAKAAVEPGRMGSPRP